MTTIWKTEKEPITALFSSLKADNPNLDRDAFLEELQDMNVFLYICEYGVKTCDLDSLRNIYLKEKESGLKGFAEGIYDTYPEHFINQLKKRNSEILKRRRGENIYEKDNECSIEKDTRI